jgi:hypothetical protein
MAHGAQTHCIQRFISAYCEGKYFAFSWAPLKIHSSRGDRHIATFDKPHQPQTDSILWHFLSVSGLRSIPSQILIGQLPIP